ncbi:MAG: FadR family transcriptional regulator [Melioribacteraceae bacterium]|nr:FadR family transcriptional regulator [Melioribacteraceae bacterium]
MFNSIDERIPIKQIIASQIEDAILTKQYAPGDRLPSENELCEQFNVSRTSVREALQVLSAHGLITIEKGRGIFVNRITSESVVNPLEKYLKLNLSKNYIIDLVNARQMIEPSIAKDASIHHDAEDIHLMKVNIEQLKNHSGGFEVLAELDMEFHQLLARATKNKVIPLLITPIHNLMPQLKSAVYANVNDAKESAVEWHTKILNAVEQRDGEKAFNCMVEHLKIAEKHARSIFNGND